MSVKIRLSRLGKKNAPQFRIVAVDSRRKRDGAFLENLGTYNPLTGTIEQFHLDRIEDWVSKGAILTDTVHRLKKQYMRSTKDQ
jgi:small subunit ribosomal protein S16